MLVLDQRAMRSTPRVRPFEFTGPKASSAAARKILRGIVVSIGDSPTTFHHMAIEFDIADCAHGKQPLISVPSRAHAVHGPPLHQPQERRTRLLAAIHLRTLRTTCLPDLRCVDAQKPDPLSFDRKGVAVDHHRATDQARRFGSVEPGVDEGKADKERECERVFTISALPCDPPRTAPPRCCARAPSHGLKGILIIWKQVSMGNQAFRNRAMAPIRFTAADKNIVDRTKAHRNSEVARAVRKTRDQLAQKSGNPVFDRELLKHHARAMLNSATAIPILVMMIALAGLFAGTGVEALIWALVTVTCYVALALVARRTIRADAASLNAEATRSLFLVAHFISGLGWLYLAAIECQACQISQFGVIKAVVLLLAMSATAIIAYALRGAVIATFTLPVVAYGVMAVRTGEPVEVVMTGLLVASLPFFVYVAGHLNRSAVAFLSFRTEKDWLIAELETAKSMSDEARRRAEEANLAKSRFLASMSHELRTPLNAILGFSEVMAGEVLGPIGNETYRDYSRDIHTSGQHLLNLINEILDLSRIEAGRYQLHEEPISLAGTLEDCCHMVELKARAKDISIVQQFEEGMPRLIADERAIRQIALNLLSNAVKFTPTGGEIRVKLGWTAGGGQYFSVKDNGPGIPADELSVVLAAFGQGSIAIKSAEQGTGLGLPIVQGLVAIHGGEFELHSRLRAGTEAIAAFPRARVMEELRPVPATERAA